MKIINPTQGGGKGERSSPRIEKYFLHVKYSQIYNPMLASSQSNSINLLTTTATTTATTKMNALTLINNDNDNAKTRSKGKNKHGKIHTTFKHRTGKKGQRTDAYFLDTTNKERNKQTKVRFDTHRREEQPDAEDVRLENIHFDNFLGNSALIKNIETVYNNEATINLNLCDFCRPDPEPEPLEEGPLSQWTQEQWDEYVRNFDPNDQFDNEQQRQLDYEAHFDAESLVDQYEEQSDYDPNDPSNFYDEEDDRRENYTEMCYHHGCWRIWHPATNKFIDEDEDDHSCY
jgi:hypothetical protein